VIICKFKCLPVLAGYFILLYCFHFTVYWSCCAIFLQKPIASFSLPIPSLVNWFPEAAVLKKRETLRQLVLSLQSRLNPDLQYDVEQGTVPSAPVMPDTCITTAGDVLNPVVTALDAVSADLVQTSSEQTDANESSESKESDNNVLGLLPSVPDDLPGRVAKIVNCTLAQTVATAADVAESATAQLVTTVTNDITLDSSLSAASEQHVYPTLRCEVLEKTESSVCDGVQQSTPFSSWSSSLTTAQDMSDRYVVSSHSKTVNDDTTEHSVISEHSVVSSLTVFEQLVNEHAGNISVVDSGRVTLSGNITDTTDKPCSAANGSSNSLCQTSGTVSCAEDSISHCVVVPCVNKSFVGDTELENSPCEPSAAESANR